MKFANIAAYKMSNGSQKRQSDEYFIRQCFVGIQVNYYPAKNGNVAFY